MNLDTQILAELTRETAAIRITAFADEGRLVQSKWHGTDRDGREIACLLGAIHPGINGAGDCPADIMPLWMAHLLPTLFDGVSAKKAPDYGRRFARALRYGNADESVLCKVLIASVEYAVSAAAKAQPDPAPEYWADVKSSCERVTGLLNKGGPEGELDAAAYADAYAAACAAAYAAHAAARDAAGAAARAAARAADAAACAAYAATDVAAETAADAAADAAYAAYEHIFDALIAAMMHGATVPVEVTP